MKRPLSSAGARVPVSSEILVAAALLLAGVPASRAAEGAPASPPPAPAPSSTESLARLMVERGVITREEGDAIIARNRAETAGATPPPANGANPPKDGVVRVRHVPEVVKEQLREDIRQEVMAQARAENWAQPDALPEWVRRVRFNGDLRIRSDSRMFSTGNDVTGAFPDFNAINRGNPYDVSSSNPNFAPQRNVDRSRDRILLRARLGAEIDLEEDFRAGVRLASGGDSSPVTANQPFGQDGGFSKYAIWIDRAFLGYTPVHKDGNLVSVVAGRFDNPFFSSEMMWDADLGFDGFCVRLESRIDDTFSPFFTAGAFPIFNTDFNYAVNRPSKFKSEDRWLYGAQIGTVVKPARDLSLRLGAAIYDFENVQGRLSTPYVPLSAADAGDTDATRPLFAQSGNSYRPLRNILPDASNGYGTSNQFQYFGLASPYRVVALTGALDYDGFSPVRVSLVGEVVKNIGFDEDTVSATAVNNLESGAFKGGDMGYDLALNVGTPTLESLWDWRVGLGYRYVESDAVMDAFTDSDLGGGGTNLRGYTLNGSVAVSRRVVLSARWFSAESIAGPRYRTDTFMFDISARF